MHVSSAIALDYFKLFKIRIIILLDVVAAASLLIASAGSPSLIPLAALLLTGSIASAGASALNNYFDRDLDSLMQRTRLRPLPARRIQPETKALLLGSVLVVLSVSLAYFLLNPSAAFFIGLGAIFYVGVYTLWLKRRTTLNIVIGGFAGSCAALAGWAAVANWVQLTPWLLALIVFLWTPSHFWSLAIRTKDDYARASIPMLPAVVGEKKAAKYLLLNSAALVIASELGFFLGAFGHVYLISATLGGLLLLYRNFRLIKTPNAYEARRSFTFSNFYLALLFIAMVADAFDTA